MLRLIRRSARLSTLVQGRRCLAATTAVSQEQQQHEFQAETRKLLDIVAKSLYSDKEVFIRELISNASDALNKRKFEQLRAGEEPPQLEISLNVSKANNTLSFFDNGIGMTQEEAIAHLGTIAKSGSKDFMNEVSETDAASAQSIIGQFGVGFYSVFMVADEVNVYTRRWNEQIGTHWSSTGEGGYTVQECSGLSVGTQIELKLNADCRQYSDVDEVLRVAQKYSSFTAFPLMLENEQVNKQEPIWMLEKNQMTDQMHLDFFRFLTSNEKDEYRFNLFYKTEMPIAVRSIFYVPKSRGSMDMMNVDSQSEIALYCRKVLISNQTDLILPRWMRFFKGVVDSEDIPLNLSRELLQNTQLIAKIRETLTDRLIKFLNDRARIEPEEYVQFYQEHKFFIAEGVAGEENAARRDEMSKLLRYESSATKSGELRSLATYVENMKEDQRYIFYLPAGNRAQAEASPYLETIKSKGYEVLFMYDPYDEVVLSRMERFKEKTLFSIENDIIDDSMSTKSIDEQLKEDDTTDLAEFDKLKDWAKEKLGPLVKDVSMTTKLSNQPSMVTVWNLGTVRNYIKMIKMQNPDQTGHFEEEQLALMAEPTLQLSTNHPVTQKLMALSESEPELAEMILMQLYHSSMAKAGLNDDAIAMANRSESLVEQFLHKL